MTEFFRFPHTPHLVWLGSGAPRGDKILGFREVKELLSGDVIVEEKVDGANVGFSVDEDGALRAQNRGSYLNLDAPQGQWKPLRRWLSNRRDALVQALGQDLMLFGEWCYALHSVRYTRLPDWFLAFDVYDRQRGEFWSADRRTELASRLNIRTTPELGRGHYDILRLKALLGPSTIADANAEGLYVRREARGVLIARAKLVRPEFAQAIEEHWSKRRLEENQLAPES